MLESDQKLLNLFKQRISDIATSKFSNKKDQAFIQWFIDIQFPGVNDTDKKITDGVSDGGIDAIVKNQNNNKTYIIQSKYTDAPFKGRLKAVPVNFITEFDNVVSKFDSEENSFDNYLKTVRSELHKDYKDLYIKGKKNKADIIWIFITTYCYNKDAEERITHLEKDQVKLNFHYFGDNLRYFSRETEGMKLSPNIELTYTTVMEPVDQIVGVKTYIAQIYLRDFVRYLNTVDKDAYIISANVRNLLRGSPINESIRETYERTPKEFWYGHNGITIICDKAIRIGNQFRLKYPQVINGGQTLRTCAESNEETDATVLVKILEIEPNQDVDDLKNKIILRSNQSNKIFRYDLKANDKLQINIANQFQRYKIYYERRRGDWDAHKDDYRNYKRLGSKNLPGSVILAQILVSTISELGGVHAAKSNRENLFEDNTYKKIFNRSFEEIFFKYTLFKAIEKILKNADFSKEIKSQINTFVYNCFAIVWESIESYKDLNSFFNNTVNDPETFFTRRHLNKELTKIVKGIFIFISDMFGKEEKKGVYITDFSKSPTTLKKMSKKLVPKYREKIRVLFDNYLL